MQATDIAFPHLGIYLNNVPKNITVFGFTIAFYGMLIALGIFLGVMYAAWSAKDNGMDPDIVWDFSIPAIIFSICGARIYYVATSWEKYADNPISIFNLRQGGIGIYGAIIGAFITMYVYTKVKKINYFFFADTLIPGLVIGQIIGRWGNFLNREAFGTYTDGLFAMRLPIDAVRASDIDSVIASHIDGVNYIQVHPTFLYECVWNIMVFLVLHFYRKHKKFDGELFFMYILGYGIGRFFIESIRTDQLIIPGTSIPISMAVSSVSAIVSLIIIIIKRRQVEKNEVKN